MSRHARIERNNYYRHHARFDVFPRILATCKQLHAEATPILYRANKFSLSEPGDAVKFLTQIRGSVQHVRHLEVEIAGYDSRDVRVEYKALFGRLEGAEALIILALPGDVKGMFSSRELAIRLGEMCRARAGWTGGEFDAKAVAEMVTFLTKAEYHRGWRRVMEREARAFGRRVQRRIMMVAE